MVDCTEFDILLCDYVDGTLDAAVRSAFEEHMASCPSCAELARECSAAVQFIATVSAPEPPPALISRIAFDIPSGGLRKASRGSLLSWLAPVLQPRFAMGMAMTLLSFSMLGRLAGIEVRQLRPADLHPVAVWAAIDDRMHRTWERAVKYYENLRLVYEVQARLQEWTKQEEEERKGRGGDDHSDTQGEQSREGKGSK